MVEVRVPTLHCNQCGHNWVPRTTSVAQCPKCKSPRFNEPKRTKAKEVKHATGTPEAAQTLPRVQQEGVPGKEGAQAAVH